jgi:hypothetical protein
LKGAIPKGIAPFSMAREIAPPTPSSAPHRFNSFDIPRPEKKPVFNAKQIAFSYDGGIHLPTWRVRHIRQHRFPPYA